MPRNTEKDKAHIHAWWKFGALLVWMAVIFFLSSQTGTPREELSWIMFLERKGAHVVEYFILTLLAFSALSVLHKSVPYQVVVGSIFSLAYAASDEFHQTLVAGRQGKLSDVLIDAMGIALAALAWMFLEKKRDKNKQIKQKTRR